MAWQTRDERQGAVPGVQGDLAFTAVPGSHQDPDPLQQQRKKQDQLLNREALAPGKILAGKSDAEFIRERTYSMYRAQANIIREAHDDYWSAVRGGMTEREAIAALDAGNVSQDRIRQIVTGVFIPRPPSVTVLHTARQRGGQERYNAILDGYRNAVRKYHPNIEGEETVWRASCQVHPAHAMTSR